jgi:hypothetical protein
MSARRLLNDRANQLMFIEHWRFFPGPRTMYLLCSNCFRPTAKMGRFSMSSFVFASHDYGDCRFHAMFAAVQ